MNKFLKGKYGALFKAETDTHHDGFQNMQQKINMEIPFTVKNLQITRFLYTLYSTKISISTTR